MLCGSKTIPLFNWEPKFYSEPIFIMKMKHSFLRTAIAALLNLFGFSLMAQLPLLATFLVESWRSYCFRTERYQNLRSQILQWDASDGTFISPPFADVAQIHHLLR
jgi:hypothetical protein